MNPFPAIDPIPLPAPVWLFKGLHVLTLALHFVAVQVLIGGLLAAVLLNLMGAFRRGTEDSGLRLGASSSLARRLPVVMTYVINLGVPPLLFSQVLYGRALYTSSVLIGAFWISVVLLLIACYWILYRFSDGAQAGRAAWWLGAVSWLLVGAIARIYSTNMTLMLSPEVWRGMYAASASGVHLPPYDPTLTPRWLFMLAGGLWSAGLWMIWVAGGRGIEGRLGGYLSGVGGRFAVVGIAAQALLYRAVLAAQPREIQAGVRSSVLLNDAALAWLAAAALVLAFALWASLRRPVSRAAAWTAVVLGVLPIGAWTLLRDGIRDLSLARNGFDVWSQPVDTNWGVVAVFFAVFAAGLAAMGWLASVMVRAKPVKEKALS